MWNELKHRRAGALTLPALQSCVFVLCFSVLEKKNDFPSYERSEGEGNTSFTHRIYTSIEPSQSSLLLWVGLALNGIFLLRSQICTAFSAQISSFVEWTEWNHPPFLNLASPFHNGVQLLLLLLDYWGTLIMQNIFVGEFVSADLFGLFSRSSLGVHLFITPNNAVRQSERRL